MSHYRCTRCSDETRTRPDQCRRCGAKTFEAVDGQSVLDRLELADRVLTTLGNALQTTRHPERAKLIRRNNAMKDMLAQSLRDVRASEALDHSPGHGAGGKPQPSSDASRGAAERPLARGGAGSRRRSQ